MGSTQASDYAAHDKAFKKNGNAGLRAHLQTNLYPPVPESMVGPSKRAIAAVNRGKHDSKIKLPDGVTWKGQKSAPAHAIVEGHRLHAWLKDEEY
jgi:hypothetical protein